MTMYVRTFALLMGVGLVAAADVPIAPETPDAPASQPEPAGRPVKVAAIAIGFDGDHDAKLKLAIEHLETAGQQGVDIACLPEEFAGTDAEPLDGPTTKAVAKLADKHRMYVICPIREQGPKGRQYNTAVLIDRHGRIAGSYRKVFVFWGENVHPSDEGVKVFDTDFGRISMLLCFDINFAELWLEASTLGAEIVFWPSAYGGGMPLNGYAICHNYYIVAVGNGDVIDGSGQTMAKIDKPRPDQFIVTLDLDRTFVHHNFNEQKVAKLLAEHAGEVELEQGAASEAWYVLRSIKPGVRVRDLCRRYDIEPLREYRLRSRREINRARKEGKPI